VTGAASARRGGVLAAVVGAATAVAALLTLGAPIAGAPASAAAGERIGSACPGEAGVSVVVDFGPYGAIDVACASRDVGSGLEALEVAGFDWVGTAQFGTFVCRINGLPTEADDQCVRTPPPDAYWSYWSAARGGSWSYQIHGPASADPAPGTVEGWAFGAGDPPGAAPPAPPAEPPTTPPPPPPPPPPASTSPPPPSSPGGDDEPATSAASSPPMTATTSAPTGPTTGETTTRPTSETTQPSQSTTTSAEAVGAEDSSSGGSPTGTVVGLVAVSAVMAGGALLALRRGRATPSA
jgi:hypothetical protein